ncbi:hypothetical protein HBH72_168750 [Parastagonospora nodorum]|nr:hypothetical protein HBH72_168750 [Parastagonospora nodorum]
MLVLIKRRLHSRALGTQKRWIRELVQPKYEIRGLENSASASLLVYSNYALQKYSLLNMCSDLRTHIIRQARIEVIAAYALNYLKLRVLKLTRVALDKFQFLSANMIALIGIVLYNTIKEYYNDGTRKIIYFYSYTIENECRTSYSNKKDIEANEREEKTRVKYKFAILAEEYMIDNRIIHALALTKDE